MGFAQEPTLDETLTAEIVAFQLAFSFIIHYLYCKNQGLELPVPDGLIGTLAGVFLPHVLHFPCVLENPSSP
jgi:hypothetical protein